jgi:hypothetical protein
MLNSFYLGPALELKGQRYDILVPLNIIIIWHFFCRIGLGQHLYTVQYTRHQLFISTYASTYSTFAIIKEKIMYYVFFPRPQIYHMFTPIRF